MVEELEDSGRLSKPWEIVEDKDWLIPSMPSAVLPF
jgi:hypothetical protein